MARYFFHQRTRDATIEDPEGSELPDLEAASAEATTAARQLIAAAVLRGIDPVGTAFDIADDRGNLLLSVAFRDVLPPSICDPQPRNPW